MKRPRLFERDKGPSLDTARLNVRLAAVADAASLAAFYARNEAHFRRWDPPGSKARFTPEYWREQLKRATDAWRADRALRLHMVLREAPDDVIGRIGFSQIARGPFQSCMLGYQIAEDKEGQGLMFEALEASIKFMFEVHKLHRIQANYIPSNTRSATLLSRLGFVEEGLAKNYLYIDGGWRDHVLTARTYAAFDTANYEST
jgi:ribosomal-protein-alanine N-acetyltransferase